jgi:hypothetical protein
MRILETLVEAIERADEQLDNSCSGAAAALKTICRARDTVLWLLGPSWTARMARAFYARARQVVRHRERFVELFNAAEVVLKELERGAEHIRVEDVERLSGALADVGVLFEEP